MNIEKIKNHTLVKPLFRVIRKTIFSLRDVYRKLATLTNNGERVDIKFSTKVNVDRLGNNEQCHYARYVFANSIIPKKSSIGDFACGTGYGSVYLAQDAHRVIGIDIDQKTITGIKKRYKKINNIEFFCKDILTIDFEKEFDAIVSFETIEHIKEEEIPHLLKKYACALKDSGILIFSTPYLQTKTEDALRAGFHQTFDIDEYKIERWLKEVGFEIKSTYYQSYNHPEISQTSEEKQFIICVAYKRDEK